MVHLKNSLSMKPLLTILICFFCYHIKAQNTYNNKIGEVKELNVYGKDATVLIGKIIINTNSEPPPIKLLESVQNQEPDGTYITSFAFGHMSATPLYNVDLKLLFSKPVDSLKEYGLIMWTGPTTPPHGLSTDKLSYIFTASQIEASINKVAAFVVRIKSKYKIETTITGVDATN